MPLQRALKAVETAAEHDDPANCITERQTAFGYWWRTTHSGNEPDQTLIGAIKLAAHVAEQEARAAGKTFLVATSAERWPDVYVFAHDHPDAKRLDLSPMYEFTPAGQLIWRGATLFEIDLFHGFFIGDGAGAIIELVIVAVEGGDCSDVILLSRGLGRRRDRFRDRVGTRLQRRR
jgi:hypothetical protein